MLKPYKQRVQATYDFLHSAVELLAGNTGKEIKEAQAKQRTAIAQSDKLALAWVADTAEYTPFEFKGYTSTYETSEVSGLPRLKYHRDQPFEKEIKFYNTYKASEVIGVPQYYVVPQGWWPVLNRLRANGVAMEKIKQDSTLRAVRYQIETYQTANRPYEGHYLHYGTQVNPVVNTYSVRAGDYLIPTNQPARRFIVEVLEPTAPDSYFAWNFFDTILQQKEGFSDYVFEDVAAQMLRENPELKKELEEAKAEDENLAKSPNQQLRWVYDRSPNKEDAYLNYPVLRIP
jgi:hypothetical protein